MILSISWKLWKFFKHFYEYLYYNLVTSPSVFLSSRPTPCTIYITIFFLSRRRFLTARDFSRSPTNVNDVPPLMSGSKTTVGKSGVGGGVGIKWMILSISWKLWKFFKHFYEYLYYNLVTSPSVFLSSRPTPCTIYITIFFLSHLRRDKVLLAEHCGGLAPAPPTNMILTLLLPLASFAEVSLGCYRHLHKWVY